MVNRCMGVRRCGVRCGVRWCGAWGYRGRQGERQAARQGLPAAPHARGYARPPPPAPAREINLYLEPVRYMYPLPLRLTFFYMREVAWGCRSAFFGSHPRRSPVGPILQGLRYLRWLYERFWVVGVWLYSLQSYAVG